MLPAVPHFHFPLPALWGLRPTSHRNCSCGLEGPPLGVGPPSHLTAFLLLTDYSLLEMLHIPGFPGATGSRCAFSPLSAVLPLWALLSTLKQGKDSQP